MLKNKKQLLRFGAVGTTNTVIDFGLLFGLSALGWPKIAANTTSTGLSFIFSFFANKKYTFKSKSSNLKREITLFVIVTLFGLWVLQNFSIWFISPLLNHLFHDDATVLFVAKLFGTAISLTWNYIMYNNVVFKTTEIAS